MAARNPFCRNWYPNEKSAVLKYLNPGAQRMQTRLACAVLPHAGWMYSGRVAGEVFSALPKADTVLFIATNHTGAGPGVSLYPEGEWAMPMGRVAVDEDLADALLSGPGPMEPDFEAHDYEHAIEVQLPFLQALWPAAKIVPIEMRDYRPETCRAVGETVARAVEARLKADPKAALCLAASSDFTHCGERYGQAPPSGETPAAFARRQDAHAIERIIKLDPQGLLGTVEDLDITMCGAGPVAAVMEAGKILGVKTAGLLSYATSSDVSGPDADSAVGYAGILMH